MTMRAGTVIDPYDDEFQSLKRLFAGRPAPDFIKTAAILDVHQHAALPDHAFAVVLMAPDRSLRKYACVDKSHTAVNVMYFLDVADEIPPPARVKTAANLLSACRHFELQPPVSLSKIAAEGRKRLIRTDGADVTVPITGREKEADVPAQRGSAKLASTMGSPYVRLDEPFLPEKLSMSKEASDGISAFPDGRLPLNDFQQVEEAVSYFRETGRTIHPRVRHEMCVKIASRAQAIGAPVPDVIRKYGSTEWAAAGEREAALTTRRQVWAHAGNEEGPGLLDLLMEKQASIGPELFAESLAEIDAQTGIDYHWDRGIADPWASTFGIQKVAAEWSWKDQDLQITESQLKKLGTEQRDRVVEKFGSQLAAGLAESPTVVFDSLPRDTKQILARMAQR